MKHLAGLDIFAEPLQINFEEGERIIGFTVLTGAFVFLPLFLYHRWKGKRLKDYTLSEENFKKMRDNK